MKYILDMPFRQDEQIPDFGSITMYFKGLKELGYIEQGNKKLRKYTLLFKDFDKLNLINNALNGSSGFIIDKNTMCFLCDGVWQIADDDQE